MRRAAVSLLLGLLPACGSGAVDAVGLDLVAHWTFDQNMGATVADSSPSHRDGSIVGSTWSWLPQGRFGGALHLEQGDYVTVDNFPNATSGWTVSAWVQISSASVGMGEVTVVSTEQVYHGGWEMNLTSHDTDSQYHFGFWVGPNPTDYAHCECSNCIQADRWQHVVAVVDGSAGTLAIYLDGVLQGRVSVSDGISPGVATLYMGRWSTTDPARLFAGSLDDISIWRRALTDGEVASLTRGPVP
jgi:hypothetical protein